MSSFTIDIALVGGIVLVAGVVLLMFRGTIGKTIGATTGIVKDYEQGVFGLANRGATDVEKAISTGYKDVKNVASGAAHGISHAASGVAHAAEKAAKGVAHEAKDIEHKVGGFISHLFGGGHHNPHHKKHQKSSKSHHHHNIIKDIGSAFTHLF